MKNNILSKKQLGINLGDIVYYTNEFFPDRQTLVFLHGMLVDHRLFDQQVAYFASNFNLILWDMPAHGSSQPFVRDYTLRDLAEYLKQILDQEKIEKVMIVGQSLGGHIAQCFAKLFPSKTTALVLISSTSLNQKYIKVSQITRFLKLASLLKIFPRRLIIKVAPSAFASSAQGKKAMSDMIKNYSKTDFISNIKHGYKILIEAIASFEFTEISLPTLLIFGEADRPGINKNLTKSWAKSLGAEPHFLDEAGHNANQDQPKQTNELIARFIKS